MACLALIPIAVSTGEAHQGLSQDIHGICQVLGPQMPRIQCPNAELRKQRNFKSWSCCFSCFFCFMLFIYKSLVLQIPYEKLFRVFRHPFNPLHNHLQKGMEHKGVLFGVNHCNNKPTRNTNATNKSRKNLLLSMKYWSFNRNPFNGLK